MRRWVLVIWGVSLVIWFAVLLWVWANWMADNDAEDFRNLCAELEAEAYMESEWVCIRDGQVVYP